MKQEKTAKKRPLSIAAFKWFVIADKCYGIWVFLRKKFQEYVSDVDIGDCI